MTRIVLVLLLKTLCSQLASMHLLHLFRDGRESRQGVPIEPIVLDPMSKGSWHRGRRLTRCAVSMVTTAPGTSHRLVEQLLLRSCRWGSPEAQEAILVVRPRIPDTLECVCMCVFSSPVRAPLRRSDLIVAQTLARYRSCFSHVTVSETPSSNGGPSDFKDDTVD
ncbi:hypothetical protein B0O80DRAFT_73018 [Mortierella sp. GBAus27b]|nr:hypothetical protein B0O80DRAFT_73018 [Mortierella sp. GBAus27b]